MPNVIKRWTLGTGRRVGEVSLSSPPEEAAKYGKPSVPLVELTDLHVPADKRRCGWGRELMYKALTYADQRGWDVYIRAIPYGEEPTEYTVLKAFYADLGFKGVARNKDNREMLRRCKPRLEVSVEEEVCAKALERWNLISIKLNLKGNIGWPDRLFLAPRCPAFIEFKRPGEEPKPRESQKLKHKTLTSLGYAVGVFNNVEDSLAFLEKHINDAKKMEPSQLPEKGDAVAAAAQRSRVVSRPRSR